MRATKTTTKQGRVKGDSVRGESRDGDGDSVEGETLCWRACCCISLWSVKRERENTMHNEVSRSNISSSELMKHTGNYSSL